MFILGENTKYLPIKNPLSIKLRNLRSVTGSRMNCSEPTCRYEFHAWRSCSRSFRTYKLLYVSLGSPHHSKLMPGLNKCCRHCKEQGKQKTGNSGKYYKRAPFMNCLRNHSVRNKCEYRAPGYRLEKHGDK